MWAGFEANAVKVVMNARMTCFWTWSSTAIFALQMAGITRSVELKGREWAFINTFALVFQVGAACNTGTVVIFMKASSAIRRSKVDTAVFAFYITLLAFAMSE